MHMAVKTLVAETDYLAIEEVDGGPRHELDEGELLEMPSATLIHNLVRDRAARQLGNFLDGEPIGVAVSETDVRLGEDIIRRPDLMFFLNQTLEGHDLFQVPVTAIPELVLEVVSPSEAAENVERKVRQYLAAGVRMVCLLFPAMRFGAVSTGEHRSYVEEQGAISVPFIPGFEFKLAPLFAGVTR
jgi:Uma2 family endonuclease